MRAACAADPSIAEVGQGVARLAGRSDGENVRRTERAGADEGWANVDGWQEGFAVSNALFAVVYYAVVRFGIDKLVALKL